MPDLLDQTSVISFIILAGLAFSIAGLIYFFFIIPSLSKELDKLDCAIDTCAESASDARNHAFEEYLARRQVQREARNNDRHRKRSETNERPAKVTDNRNPVSQQQVETYSSIDSFSCSGSSGSSFSSDC